ncbi:MAG: hypothetical protein H7Y06_02565 [Opitutaceae bacterium]|nr:hypothetical protein [Opitutaceae bacterium]
MSLSGSIIYQLWHRPRGWLANTRRQGGLRAVWLTARGRHAMEAAAHHLPSIAVGAPSPGRPELAFLTGTQLWFQTAFCLHTFLSHSTERPPVLIVSDGTLTARQSSTLARLFPGAVIESTAETTTRITASLPPDRYPTFHRLLSRHVLLRKLACIHPPDSPPRLFLDSDMLFNARPVALETWLHAPERPMFMTDVVNAYGYPLGELTRLAGHAVPEHLNTGVSAIPAGFLDWDLLERWLDTLVSNHGTSYYMEQALFALATAGHTYEALDATCYIVTPDSASAQNAQGLLHHYVNLSKSHYFRHAWRTHTPLCT